MPANHYWLQEPHIVGVDYVGAVSSEDIEQVMGQCLAIVDRSPAYFLVDTSRLESVPRDLLKLGIMLKFLNHPNTQWLIFVGLHNPVVAFAVRLLVHKKVKLIPDRAEGLAFLQDRVQQEIQTNPS